jgi:two-component system nitrogen regulation response regulator NtrX
VEAVRAGAHDFLLKPLETERLVVTVGNAMEVRRLRLERDGLAERLRAEYRMVGVSQALGLICATIERVAPTGATVLITGETGAGKELVARAVYARSVRAAKPFVRINCAAIPEELIESELFGHEKGAFTGAVAAKRGKFHAAAGGTLFLDEVADMSPKTQAKLLRALETGEIEMVGATHPETVDVRILAATNRDLAEEVREGRFRSDLFYRLNTVRIDVPPLRDRTEDIVPMAEHFLTEYADRYGLLRRQLSPSAKSALLQHAWPGNVRELRNIIERLVIMAPGDTMERLIVMTEASVIEGSHVVDAIRSTSVALEMPVGEVADFRAAVRGFERSLLERALEAHDWNVAAAAHALNLEPANLYKKLASHAISRP